MGVLSEQSFVTSSHIAPQFHFRVYKVRQLPSLPPKPSSAQKKQQQHSVWLYFQNFKVGNILRLFCLSIKYSQKTKAGLYYFPSCVFNTFFIKNLVDLFVFFFCIFLTVIKMHLSQPCKHQLPSFNDCKKKRQPLSWVN